MAEIINAKEAATLRTVVGSLAKKVDALSEKIDGVVTAQGKVDTSLQEMATARKTGTPVQYMKADVVQQTIEDKLNSQLVESKVTVDVKNATIGKESKEKIDGLMKSTGSLITAAENLVESNKAIKPRKPILNLTVEGNKKLFWIALGLSSFYALLALLVIILTNNKVATMQEDLQNLPSYWADRAYQAAVLRDFRNPGLEYQDTYTLFTDEPEKAKEHVEGLELNAKGYQEWKRYILSLIQEKDSRDIRVIDTEKKNGEVWCLYRFYDEETERSIHVWPNKKVEETTDKNVTDLASAQRYSKRNIWTVIREAPETIAE